MALAAAFTGQVGDAVAVGAARVAEVRRRGAIGVLVPILAILAAGRAWVGDHAGAFADAGEAAELAAHLGYAADGSVAVEMLAWQLAARGLHDEARESLDPGADAHRPGRHHERRRPPGPHVRVLRAVPRRPGRGRLAARAAPHRRRRRGSKR